MNTEGEARYHADEVDLGDGVFAEVVYEYSYRVSGDDVDILSIDDMAFKSITGPEGENLPVVVTREYENAARNEFWKIFADFADDQIRDKLRMGEIAVDY